MRPLRTRLSEERGWGLVSSVLVVGILHLALPAAAVARGHPAEAVRARAQVGELVQPRRGRARRVGVRAREGVAGARDRRVPVHVHADVDEPRTAPAPDLLTGTLHRRRLHATATGPCRSATTRGPSTTTRRSCPSRPSWDSNGNAKVWVRADAHAAEGNRTVVALVKRLDRSETFPRNAITAGWFTVTNNGNKIMVDTKGDAAQPAPVAVRCRGSRAIRLPRLQTRADRSLA